MLPALAIVARVARAICPDFNSLAMLLVQMELALIAGTVLALVCTTPFRFVILPITLIDVAVRVD